MRQAEERGEHGKPARAEGLWGRSLPWSYTLLISGLLVVAYWPCMEGSLLWDDSAHVTRADLRPFSGLVRIWANLRETQQYYPVLHSAFWLEHRLWGDGTLGYHVVNVALHGFNACMLGVLLVRLGRARSGARFPKEAAWLAALLFAVHPVCVESVAWISEQKNTLSLAFYLLSAGAYLRFSENRRWSHYLGASLLFVAALGTKSVTATLPAALLVVVWWTRGRLKIRRDAFPLVPWFITAGASGLLTAWVERHVVGAEGAGFDLSFVQRLLLAARAVWFYLVKLLVPANLVFIYPRWRVEPGDLRAWVLLAEVVAFTAILWLLRGRSRGPLAAWLFFTGSLFPALGFFNLFPFLYSYVADHFQYMASIGVFATCGYAIVRLVERMPAGARPWGRVACGVLVAALAFLTRLQSSTYRSSEILYRTTLERNPSCWMAENNLAAELEGSGRSQEALAHYRRALEIRPDYPEAHNNLGNLLLSTRGAEAEALHHYEEALRIRPDFAEAHSDLANLLSRIPGREAEAVSHYQRALEVSPGDATAHYDLALLLSRLPGRDAEAIGQYRISLGLRPESAEAHNNLGILLARSPESAGGAIQEFMEAVRLDPKYTSAYLNMAILQLHQGRPDEARASCEKALQLDPGNSFAAQILGSLRNTPGR